MMELLDSFVDTKEKRRHLLYIITLLFCIVLLLPYVYLGMRLIRLSDYASAFSLLDDAVISKTYVARIVLAVLTAPSFSFVHVAAILLQELHMSEVITMVLLIVIFPKVDEKRIVTWLLFLFLIGVCGIFLCMLFGFQSTSLAQAILYLRSIGWLCFGIGGIAFLACLFYTYQQILRYCRSLQITAVEIKE